MRIGTGVFSIGRRSSKRQFDIIELHSRQHVDALRDQPEILDFRLAPLAQHNRLPRQRHTRHC
jgi:hypothetical protein